jgi:hypothetical protein
MNKVYAVVFSNYFPLEVDSLWEHEEDANDRARELVYAGNYGWGVTEMEVQ